MVRRTEATTVDKKWTNKTQYSTKLQKNSRKNFREFPGIPEKFVKNFPFPGLLKIREKGKLSA